MHKNMLVHANTAMKPKVVKTKPEEFTRLFNELRARKQKVIYLLCGYDGINYVKTFGVELAREQYEEVERLCTGEIPPIAKKASQIVMTTIHEKNKSDEVFIIKKYLLIF